MLDSKASHAVKANHYAVDKANKEGREGARSKYPSALLPVKYHRDQDLADAWLDGFNRETNRLKEITP